jgi:hypothetical protein
MLAKVHHRAADRVTSKQADKDPAYARKAQQTQDRAWDRLAVKEQGVAEEQDPVAAFLARGGQVQQGKLHKPRKGELWQGSSHIGAAGGRGSKGRVTGLAANTNPKGGKPVVSAESADSGEYDYEGDMAKDDLQTMVRAARRLNGMLDDNENMPEWVQSKINKAADYVDTAADYIESNQDEQGAAGGLNEFSPPGSNDGGDDGFSEETLKRLASQWYNGDEDPRVERTLMAAGWEIGQDEGYDDEPGVFVVQAGDINGNSYISWPAHELKQGVAEGKPEKPEPPKADYGPDYQDMVARVKKLAGLGPLKTVYDPKKRVYRNVPVAQQPNKK